MQMLAVNDRLMTIADDSKPPTQYATWRQLNCVQPIRAHGAGPARDYEAWGDLPIVLQCDGCGRMRRYAGSTPSTWVWMLLDRVLLTETRECEHCRVLTFRGSAVPTA